MRLNAVYWWQAQHHKSLYFWTIFLYIILTFCPVRFMPVRLQQWLKHTEMLNEWNTQDQTFLFFYISPVNNHTWSAIFIHTIPLFCRCCSIIILHTRSWTLPSPTGRSIMTKAFFPPLVAMVNHVLSETAPDSSEDWLSVHLIQSAMLLWPWSAEVTSSSANTPRTQHLIEVYLHSQHLCWWC